MLSAVPLARARMVVFADVELFNVEFAHNTCFGKYLYELSATFLLNQKIMVKYLLMPEKRLQSVDDFINEFSDKNALPL